MRVGSVVVVPVDAPVAGSHVGVVSRLTIDGPDTVTSSVAWATWTYELFAVA